MHVLNAAGLCICKSRCTFFWFLAKKRVKISLWLHQHHLRLPYFKYFSKCTKNHTKHYFFFKTNNYHHSLARSLLPGQRIWLHVFYEMHALNREDRQHRKRVKSSISRNKNAKAYVFPSKLFWTKNSPWRWVFFFLCFCTRC